MRRRRRAVGGRACVGGGGACLMRSCDKERAARASFGFEKWEKKLNRLPEREEGSVDELWVEEVNENPGGRVSPRRLMEQGALNTLEGSVTSSVSASSGEIGESTMGDVYWLSAVTYCRRTSESLDSGEGACEGDRGGAALEGCAASTGSTGETLETLLLAAREGVQRTGRHYRQARRQWRLACAALARLATAWVHCSRASRPRAASSQEGAPMCDEARAAGRQWARQR